MSIIHQAMVDVERKVAEVKGPAQHRKAHIRLRDFDVEVTMDINTLYELFDKALENGTTLELVDDWGSLWALNPVYIAGIRVKEWRVERNNP